MTTTENTILHIWKVLAGIYLFEMTTTENLDNQVNEIDCGIDLLEMTTTEKKTVIFCFRYLLA